MAVRVLDQQNLSYFLGRIEKLSKDSPRKFGTMDVTKMMRHMRNAFETAMGETNLPDASKPFVGKFLYYVITHVITTWPGGRIKAPDYWTPPSDHSYEEERELFVGALKRFVGHLESKPGTVAKHPVLGALTMPQWGRLNGLHLAHHLRQFSA
ncbi:MAG: DUF1569 domain-containing protein [Candidatus Hydrogenedentota bacterium]